MLENISKLKCFIASAIACLALSSVGSAAQVMPAPGFNLGNTLESTWGYAHPTQALINSIADAGFKTLRVPCAWDFNSTNGTLNAAYMTEVANVVDWALAKNMYVIINCHWDGGWFERHQFDTYDSTLNSKLINIWTQVANRFKNYDSVKLSFACANEPGIGNQAQTDVLYQYYQNWINAMRANGGNNAVRWLVVQAGSVWDWNVLLNYGRNLPTDSAGKLMIEEHTYDPGEFTVQGSDESWRAMKYFWGSAYHVSGSLAYRNSTSAWEESFLQAQLAKLKTAFVDRGYPVLIGEWAGQPKPALAELTGVYKDQNFRSVTYYNKYMENLISSFGFSGTYFAGQGDLFDATTGAVQNQDKLNSILGISALPPIPGLSTDAAGTAHLVNVSIRATAGTGANTLIAGFVLSGNGAKPILLRGIGPTLSDYKVSDPLVDPSIVLYNSGGASLGKNDDWGGASTLSSTFTSLGAFSLAASSKDAALLTPLTAGGHTMHVTTSNSTSGAALAEVYDADTSSTNLHLVNISGRGAVDASSNLIAGFVVNGTGSMNVLVRAVGPTLTDYGVTGVLSNPKVTIYNSAGVSIASNDDWGGSTALSSTFTQVGAFTLPASSKDAAILLTLTPGAYTAVVSGVNSATGVALVEVYATPSSDGLSAGTPLATPLAWITIGS